MKIRHAALERALIYVGTVETPRGSNRGSRIDEWNRLAGVPVGSYWCMSFVHAMFYRVSGLVLPGGASVGAFLSGARSRGWVVSRPLRGDIVCYEFNEGAYAYDDHVGIVKRVLALRWWGNKFTGYVETVEGNTSGGELGSQANGGGVFIRRRWIRGIGATFVRVPGNTR